MKVGHIAYQAIIDYLNNRTDCIALNSIIEVNGIVHPRPTYGYFSYTNIEGENKECVFEHLGGIIVVSKKDFDEILKLPYTAKVEIAICLQSPVWGDWGVYWDQVMVKGSFDAGQLSLTRSKFSPCFHFMITAIGDEFFKIRFDSWEKQSCYYSANSHPLTTRRQKRLDRKERRIYKIANPMGFERKIW